MSKFVIFFIRIYQKIVSSIGIRVCRFYPSCSEYMIQSIIKKGLLKGFFQGCLRITKCNPFHSGGYDPVK